MLQPGDVLAGYRIEAVAGVGGMGVVYRAVQISLDRPVALKVLSSTLVGNRTFRERFRREGRHAAALDHPNIIPVYEAGESNGLMFIAMRLVDGPSLADLIDRRELSGREALRIVGAMAGALDAAHEAGLVHRDIKPQNILLTPAGHPYLADFGITKGSDHAGLTHSGDFVGSLNYVAPEQIEGKDVGGASDIYALTGVLYQALSGAYPYQRDTDAALMHAHLAADPPAFSARGIEAPAALDDVFARGMAKLPEDRFGSAGELMRAATEALAGVDERTLAARPAFPLPGAEPAGDGAAAAEPTRADQLGWVDPPADLTPSSQAIPVTSVADRTAVDRPRASAAAATLEQPEDAPPASPAADRPRRALPAWLAPAGIVAGAVVAIVAGYLVGREPAAPEPARAASGAVSIAHDAGWRAASGGIEGLTVAEPVVLRAGNGVTLVAGRLDAKGASFDPMPSGLAARLAPGAEHAAVRVGSRSFARTTGTLASGDALWAGFAPDSKGWVAVVCEGPGASQVCPELAATLRTPGASAAHLGPRAATIDELSAALTALSGARKAAATGLAAKDVKKRAAAASKLAVAHAKAAAGVRAAPGAWERRWVGGPFEALAAGLGDEAAQLKRMASAAKSKERARYADARSRLKAAEPRVQRAMDRLAAAGYLEA